MFHVSAGSAAIMRVLNLNLRNAETVLSTGNEGTVIHHVSIYYAFVAHIPNHNYI